MTTPSETSTLSSTDPRSVSAQAVATAGAAIAAVQPAQLTWNEQVLHTALGAALAALPSGDHEVAFAAMAAILPAQVAANGRPFGNPIASKQDAPLVDQLVAWYGRNP